MTITRSKIADYHPELLLLEPAEFDVAIMGIAERADGQMAVAYDAAECIRVLERQGMSHEDAEEFFQFNTAGAYVGEHTPVFIHTAFAE